MKTVMVAVFGMIALAAVAQDEDHRTDEYMRQLRGALQVLMITPDPNWSSRCMENLVKYEELQGLAESPANRNSNNAVQMALSVLEKATQVCRLEAQSYCKVATSSEAKEACNQFEPD